MENPLRYNQSSFKNPLAVFNARELVTSLKVSVILKF